MRFIYFIFALLLAVLPASESIAGPGDFVADFQGGCSPLVVHFHVADTCSNCTYSWDFGNSTSIIAGDSVSTTYIGVGSYTVTLTTHRGTEVFTKTMPISVFPPPTVNFEAVDTAVCPGALIKFVSTSSSVEGPLSSTWNYGDGSATDTGSTPGHAYAVPGYFNVTLVATSQHGCISTLTRAKYIHIFNPPVAGYNPSGQLIACKPPVTFSFTNTSTGTGPLTYAWSFGDGSTSTKLNPVYTYTTAGSYPVKNIVTDIHGCKDSIVRAGQVTVGGVHAAFTHTAPICEKTVATFTNASTADLLRVWNYNDGSQLDTSYNTTHVFAHAGTYTVTLTAFNNGCTDTSKQQITVTTAPSADFTISPDHACPGTLSTFTSAAPPGSTITWTYDSSVTQTAQNGSRVLQPVFPHRIDMQVNDPGTGCTINVTKYDTIYDMQAHGSPSPAEGCKPMSTSFSVDPTTLTPDGLSHGYPFPIASYSWDFGDGSPTESGPHPPHIYTDTGKYMAHVTLTSIYGCTATSDMELKVGLMHGAKFTASPLHVCVRDSVHFIATLNDSSEHVDEFVWDFVELGQSDTIGKHAYKFKMPGQYVVTLTAVYHGCKDSGYAMQDTITVDSSASFIAGEITCYPKTRVIFGDSSVGADERLWIFGDGDTSSVANPIHDYPSTGFYQVQLATYNILSGCRDTNLVNLKVLDPDPHLYADDTGICKHGLVNFWSSITGKVGGPYKWYIDDHLISGVDTFNSYVFDTAGQHTVMLVITDEHLCLDTATLIRHKITPLLEDSTYHITVGAPRPGFIVSSPVGCIPLTITLTDTSKGVPGATPDRFIWKFGDGSSDTTDLRAITHVYTSTGTFIISDNVTDNLGCRDSVSRTGLTTYGAHATFYTLNAHPCPGVPVSFTNTTANLVSSVWHFGDDSTSTTKNPLHLYKDTGTYNVSLTITDSHGCTHSDTVRNYISVSKPDASFNMSDSLSVCAHLPVHFSNTTTGADSSIWSFGDGAVSVLTSPDNLYTTSGIFQVRLIAANLYGCRDTTYDTVKIFGYSGSFSYGPIIGCSPLRVHFSSSFTNVSKAVWDFSDGQTVVTSKLDTISHVYVGVGAYMPKLILNGTAGCESTSLGLDTIKVDTVMANFITTPAEICAGTPFHFVDLSTHHWSPVISRTWVYDHDTSHLLSPLYTTVVADTYTVRLTAVNGWGCQDTLNRKIVIYPLPDVTARRDTLICTNDTATISGYGAVSYTWSPAVALTCTNCTTTKSFPSALTAYIVTGTDSHGCKDTSIVKVNVFTPVISGTTPTCSGESDTLTISGGTGTWLSSNVAVGTVGVASGVVTAISAGTTIITYSLTGSACFDTKLVTVNPEPYAGIISGPAHVCLNDTVVLDNDTTGGTWSNITANTSILPTSMGSLKVAGMAVGTDTIIYSVTNSCGSIDTAFIISVAPLPVITSTVDHLCAGATTSMNTTITGGSWSSLDGGVATVDEHTGILSSNAVSALDTATITYVTPLGCRDTTTLAIFPIPNAGAITGPAKICKGGIFTLTDVQGGGLWQSGDTAIAAIDSFTGIVNATGIGATAITYIMGPNGGGCMDSAFYPVNIIASEFRIEPEITDVNCYKAHDGAISVNITNGIKPLHYLWSTGDSTSAISNLDTGQYVIHIREEVTQCESADSFRIAQPDSIVITATALTKDECKTNTGSMTASVTGGTAPYGYRWSNNAINALSATQTDLPAGIYKITITDAKQCIDTALVTVEDTSCLEIIVRNGISANGDGINDMWVIEGLKYYFNNTVQVFDKWGDLVFEGRDYKNDWPGTGKNGALLPDGSYYYLVKLNEPSKTGGPDTFTGTLLIKR